MNKLALAAPSAPGFAQRHLTYPCFKRLTVPRISRSPRVPDLQNIRSIQVDADLYFHGPTDEPTHLMFFLLGLEDQVGVHFRIDLLRCQQDALPCPTGIETIDESSLGFYSDALSKCLESHEICRRRSGGDDWIPSRLLQLDLDGQTRLIHRDEAQATGHKIEYLTLSHVWGKEEFLTLTTRNMADLSRGIDLSSLPKCFQDAVILTKRLGGKYLWIDSLCIIQDSEQDWIIESGQMHRVYSNGLCNLAASHQSILNRGLFCSRDPEIGAPFTVDHCWTAPDQVERFTLYPDFPKLVKDGGPLYSRGWVVQEQKLSPRTLHMAAFPIWECREAVLTEVFLSEDLSTEHAWEKPTGKFHLESFGEAPEEYWAGLVVDFTSCDLTRDEDKLVAVSGIARTVSETLGKQYYAGLWGDNLLRGLLWRKYTRFDQSLRYEHYIAPSWSWASVRGIATLFHQTIAKPLATDLSVRVLPKNGDPFGQLDGGRLRLRGILFEFPSLIEIMPHKDTCRYSREFKGYDTYAFHLDNSSWDDCGHNHTWFLPLALSPDASIKPGLEICGILLQNAKDGSRDAVYNRVGHVIVTHEGDIAGTEWLMDDWEPLPWSEERYTEIEIE